MPRQARFYNEAGIYHIMMRGNEKKKIFLDNDDRKRFITTLFEIVKEEETDIYAYCLMDNHVHLLLHEEPEDIARLMKRINVSFASYFNKKYKRVGHLFQDRFKSECVDSIDYLLAAVRYIHNNPLNAGIVSSPEKYRWSSYYDYINTRKRNNIKTDKVLNIFSENKIEAMKQFIEFGGLDSDIRFIDFLEQSNDEIRDEQVKRANEALNNILSSKGLCISDLSEKTNYNLRNEIVKSLKEAFNLSSRQMAAITKLGKGTILKIFKEMDDAADQADKRDE